MFVQKGAISEVEVVKRCGEAEQKEKWRQKRRLRAICSKRSHGLDHETTDVGVGGI